MAIFRWVLIQELNPKLFDEFEWARAYGESQGDHYAKGNFTGKIGWGSDPGGGNPHPLTPTIDTREGFILNHFINNGLFKP